jgi:hypothetical protein
MRFRRSGMPILYLVHYFGIIVKSGVSLYLNIQTK